MAIIAIFLYRISLKNSLRVSFIFNRKKNIELIFLKFRKNFVQHNILLYVNFHKLWYIYIHCIFSIIFFILVFLIRIHVKHPKIESEII